MKLVLLNIWMIMALSIDPLHINFGHDVSRQNWRVINDQVMGGLSESELFYTSTTFVFRGNVSLKNNGGFSALKGPFEDIDLSNFSSFRIKYRSTGIPLAMTLETDPQYYMPYFKVKLDGTEGEWEEKIIPLKDFEIYSLSKRMGKEITQDQLKNIIRMGFITCGKKEGSFEFEVEYLNFQ